jgi:4-amino-4-deoxy-L-arabinose transferase-like glycosyltransferase
MPAVLPRDDAAGRAARRRTLALAALIALALALRLGWIAWADFRPTLSDDAGRYDFLGRSLAEGGGFVNPNGATTMFWPPGYPFVLAAVYKLWPERAFGDHEVIAALVLNAALGAATVALTYALARRAYDERVGLVAAAMVALFPSLVFFAGVTLTETAFTTLLLLGVWLIVVSDERRDVRIVALAALVLGFATLVRGLALLAPLALVPYGWRIHGAWRPALLRAGVIAAAMLLVVAPWTIRNYVESGSLVGISSNAGVDFYIGHSEGADGRGRKVDELVFQYPELPAAEAEARVSSDGFERGVRWAARHPLTEVSLSARKVWWLWYRDDEALRWTDGHGERDVMPEGVRRALIVLSNVFYWPVVLLAAAALLTTRWWRRPAGVLLVALLVCWTLAHVAFFGDPRFHAPMTPVIAVFAAAAIVAGVSRATRRGATAPRPPPG